MIAIFTHVGLDPIKGGGVAAYVQNLCNVLKSSGKSYDVLNVSQTNIFSLLLFFKYVRYRGTVVLNSGFHPFSLLMILFSGSDNLIVMPHGEFLDSALNLKRCKKLVVLWIVKFLSNYMRSSKYLTVVASTNQEVCNFRRFFSVYKAEVVQDVVCLPVSINHCELKSAHDDTRLHIVMIGRMVRMKGFLKVLDDIATEQFTGAEKVSIYYLKEDDDYLCEVRDAAHRLVRLGIGVELFEGRNSLEIYNDCKDTNCILIVPSDFESFSYVLVENLWMPNKPIISFKNALTDFLVSNGHCRMASKGRFVDSILANEKADTFAVKELMLGYICGINSRTVEILCEVGT